MTQTARPTGAARRVSRHVSGGGRVIHSFPIQVFDGLLANIHVIENGDEFYLVDAGSGVPESNRQLLEGLQAIETRSGRSVDPSALEAILVTHGHIDHFGGLPFLRQFTQAPIAVHSLDRATLTHHAERVVVASRRLEAFLETAGVPKERRSELMQVYLWAKSFYRPVQVQFSLEEGRPAPGGFEVIHAPGHCPGQVCLRVDDVLLTADHVLSRTTPHQAPESITPSTGLGHYFESLAKVGRMEGVTVGLGGHEDPIRDLPGRIAEIRAMHDQRLEQTLDLCRSARSVAEISLELFGPVRSHHVLLALEETGAHVEHLYRLGHLAADNLDEMKNEERPVIRYKRI